MHRNCYMCHPSHLPPDLSNRRMFYVHGNTPKGITWKVLSLVLQKVGSACVVGFALSSLYFYISMAFSFYLIRSLFRFMFLHSSTPLLPSRSFQPSALLLSQGASPLDSPPWFSMNMGCVGRDPCTMTIVHASATATVHACVWPQTLHVPCPQ